MLYHFAIQWMRPDEPPLFAIVVDCDEADDFSEFCEDIYKTVPESDRLKASLLICRLPVSRGFSGQLISRLCKKGGAASIPKKQKLLLSIRDAIASGDSFLNRRFGHMEVRLLYSEDYSISLSDDINPVKCPFVAITARQMPVFIEHVQQTELRGLLEGSPALFPSLGGVPYLTPSGDLARTFVRIGNIQGRRSAVHAMFFWMLPYLKKASAILVDTWSISSIAYNASRLLARYRGSASLIIRVDMLSEYHSNSETSLKLNLEVLRRFLNPDAPIAPDNEVIFLVSAVRTGNLLRQIKSTMAGLGYELAAIRFLVLYALCPPLADRFLCDLSHIPFDFDERLSSSEVVPPTTITRAVLSDAQDTSSVSAVRERDESRSEETKSGDVIKSLGAHGPPAHPGTAPRISKARGEPPKTPHIVIDPATYFPKIRNEVEIEIRNPQIRADRQVYSGYAGLDVFLVHRTQQDDRAPRLHAVYVETAKLIETARFQRRLANYVQKLGRAPDLVVAPDHIRAKRLVELVDAELGKRFDRSIKQLFHPNLHVNPSYQQPQDEELRLAFANLGPDSEILIVDDAFVTGTGLYQYSQHLRYMGGGYLGRIDFLVAIARPPDIAKWIEAKRLLKYRPPRPNGQNGPENTVEAIETIVLPNWDTTNCPWCIEKGSLEDYQALVSPMPSRLSDRLRMLGEKDDQGMAQQLFLEGRDSLPIRLSSNSLFTADQTSQAAGFAAVAGGIQRLRTDQSDVKLGPYRYPLSTILQSDEYLQLVYNDSLLRASFLRAAHREELSYLDVGRENERAAYAYDLICDASGEVNNLALELCWQVLQGKLPPKLFEMASVSRFTCLGVEEEVGYLRDVYAKRPRRPIE